MKKISVLLFAAAMMMVSCAMETAEPETKVGESPVFHASFENCEATKTFVDDQLHLYWTADDRLSIFTNTYNQQYSFQGETGDNSGSFKKIESGEFVTGSDLTANYAVYPYNPGTKIAYDGKITLTLPAEQKYAEKSFGLGANTMVAVTSNSSDCFLPFKNLCGYLVVKLYGEGSVKSVTLEGNNGERIAGKAVVTASHDGIPTLVIDETGTGSITIDCGEGVALGPTSAAATEFWFCIPPTTFSHGFTIKVTNTNGFFMEKVTSSEKVFERNTKYAMATIEGVFDQLDLPEFVPFEDANFKAYCVENFDTDGDGEISIEEGEKVDSIVVDGGVMKSLKGIEYFSKLDYLDCSLKFYQCDMDSDGKWHWYDSNGDEVFSKLTSLDVSGCVALTGLNCWGNLLTGLDMSKNTALTSLNCSDNQLTSLDVSRNTALTSLNCSGNQLTSLDVSNNAALANLSCGCNQLTSLDVSRNTALTGLICSDNQLTSLDVSKNTALTFFAFDFNELTSLNLSKNTALTHLICSDNQFTSLDVSRNTALTYLDCQLNELTSLDVSKNTALTHLICSDNQLTSLDVSNNTALTYLDCQLNELTSLDVSRNTALTYLQCYNNLLTSLDVSKNTALIYLHCYNNQISTIYVWEGFNPDIMNIVKDPQASFVVKQ